MHSKFLTPEEVRVHAQALKLLNDAGIHYVVSGAVALGYYTGLWRNTKDLDLFLVPQDITPAMIQLASHGYEVATLAEHWLAHAKIGQYYVDLIHGFGGWRAQIDAEWYARGVPAEVLGQPVRVTPVEDLIWIKAYVCHRERFDGADICHLIQARHATLDWHHLLRRFGDGWELLLFYLSLYRFVYPSHRSDIPAWVTRELANRRSAQARRPWNGPPVCRGTLLDRFSYLGDIQQGLADGRLPYVEAQGYSERDLVADRAEALRVVETGGVKPDRAA
jgi:hypothetical protein